ncbi:MAG: hypothetical protein NT154_40795, partial [Verrucomicrobia bacterium]|nr:hypothetical protein [Verrucomicrobiota bacterium]
SASDYGRIAFIGTAPLAGAFSATLIGGFSPAPGTQFQVLSSGGLSGGFTSFALPTHFYVTDNALSVFLTMGSGGPATLLCSVLAGSNFTFAFQSEAGLSYRVESSGDLTGTNWVFHTNFTGDGSPLQFATPVTNTPRRFFRLSKP